MGSNNTTVETYTLTTALDLRRRELLALVGGGGKTSLMFALAKELRKAKKKVVTSTTTKIWHSETSGSPSVIFTRSESSWQKKLRAGLRSHGHVFIGQGLLDTGKVEGLTSEILNDLFLDESIDYVLVEADGSARHPVKVPAEHEPVIPSSATMVVAVLGLEAIGQEMGPGIVFRIERFEKMTGLTPGQRLVPSVLTEVFMHPNGLFKSSAINARRVVFLNKLDLLQEGNEANELANGVLQDATSRIDHVVVGSVKDGLYHKYLKTTSTEARQ